MSCEEVRFHDYSLTQVGGGGAGGHSSAGMCCLTGVADRYQVPAAIPLTHTHAHARHTVTHSLACLCTHGCGLPAHLLVWHSLGSTVLLLLLQCPLQQVTHAQIYQLQAQLNQAVSVKQQDIQEVYQVRAGINCTPLC